MRILISGAGIAGLAAANFLQRNDHSVSVIDKTPAFRKLGYALSVKSFGLKVLAELGLQGELARHSIEHRQLSFHDATGKLLKVHSGEVAQKATFGSILTLRSELHEVLYRAVHDRVAIELGLHPTRITQDEAEGPVQVALSNGEVRTLDLLVCAEGLRSSTRELVIPDVATKGTKPFGIVYAAGHIAGEHGVDTSGVHMYFGAGRFLFLIPMTPRDLVVQLFYREDHPTGGAHVFSAERVLATYHAFPTELRQRIEAMAAGGSAFSDSVAMIRLPALTRGRVVFLGDAGYCPTFLSGMGASLGLLGAKVLSDALRSGTPLPAALHRYNAVMLPVVHHFQHNAESIVGFVRSENPVVTAIRDAFIHWLPPSLAALSWSRQFDVEQKLLHGIV